MELYPLIVLIVQQCVHVNSDVDYFHKYRQRQHNFLTLDGEERGFNRRNSDRTQRFLTFNNDESNIRVEIEFSVPFLEIPLDNKGHHGLFGGGGGLFPSLSVNAKSAIVVTTLFFASYLLVPSLVHSFLPTVHGRHHERELEESRITRLVRGVETALHVNATACWQQGVCSLVRGSRFNTSTAGLGKILDGLSSISWIEGLTRGTALDEAFLSARQEARGCQVLRSRCVLDSEHSKKSESPRQYVDQQLVNKYSSSSRRQEVNN